MIIAPLLVSDSVHDIQGADTISLLAKHHTVSPGASTVIKIGKQSQRYVRKPKFKTTHFPHRLEKHREVGRGAQQALKHVWQETGGAWHPLSSPAPKAAGDRTPRATRSRGQGWHCLLCACKEPSELQPRQGLSQVSAWQHVEWIKAVVHI